MAVLAGLRGRGDAMLLHFLAQAESTRCCSIPWMNVWVQRLLVNHFWREVERLFGYTSATPSLRDFAVSLFRGANPLDKQVKLHPHAKVFLQRWKDSQAHRDSFRDWSRQMERELQIEAALSGLEERATLGDWDTFEIFEKFTLHRLCQSFQKGASAIDLRAVMQERRTSFWHAEHEHGYAAIEQAVELRELLASAELTVDSLGAGVNRYLTSWWRIDMAYRLCTRNLRQYGQLQLMEQICELGRESVCEQFPASSGRSLERSR